MVPARGRRRRDRLYESRLRSADRTGDFSSDPTNARDSASACDTANACHAACCGFQHRRRADRLPAATGSGCGRNVESRAASTPWTGTTCAGQWRNGERGPATATRPDARLGTQSNARRDGHQSTVTTAGSRDDCDGEHSTAAPCCCESRDFATATACSLGGR